MRAVSLGVVVLVLVSGCGRDVSRPDRPSSSPTASSLAAASPAASSPAPATSAAAHPAGRPATSRPAASRTAVPTARRSPSPARAPSGAAISTRLSALDRRAGVRSLSVAASGSGRLKVVPGRSAAPGRGRVYRIRVEVESGLDVDRAAFAAYVLATLNDRRSWTENGRRRFARTDGAADIRVVLASPKLSAAICRPLRTFGKLSCRQGDQAVLTTYRWVKAIPEYAGDRDGYRHYVVNHEVGHALGHPHEYCAGKGRMAPVMMQQTKGLQGCRPNPWPHPKRSPS